MGEAVATTQAEEHHGQIPRITQEKAAQHLEITEAKEMEPPEKC